MQTDALVVKDPNRRPAVAGVVLAAGSSTRMGQNKLLFELRGETLVRRALRVSLEAGLDPVVLVVGHEASRVRNELFGLPVLAVENPDYQAGQRSSLQAGIKFLMERAPAVDSALVVLADMPFVTEAMLKTVVARYRASGTKLVISRYGEVIAPPNLYDRSLFTELMALRGKHCAKRVIRKHEAESLTVDWPAEALRDVDVPEDYERLTGAFAGV